MYGADASFTVAEFNEKLVDILNGARNLYYRLGDGNPELDRTVVNQIARMRAMGRRGVQAPHTIIDPGTILHEMRLIKTEADLALLRRAVDDLVVDVSKAELLGNQLADLLGARAGGVAARAQPGHRHAVSVRRRPLDRATRSPARGEGSPEDGRAHVPRPRVSQLLRSGKDKTLYRD